jgi:hypothetical protein
LKDIMNDGIKMSGEDTKTRVSLVEKVVRGSWF